MERSTPAARNKLKTLMFKKQDGICALCNKPLVQKGSELDRFNAFHGYVESNGAIVKSGVWPFKPHPAFDPA